MKPDPTTPGESATGVLFLGGAGLPAWIWDDVRADLGDVCSTAVVRYPRDGVASLADYADAAAAQAPWPTFAVVAHSVGGVVAGELTARHAERVTGLLGVSAAFPGPGRSFVRSLPFPARLVLGAVVRLVGTRPPASAIRSGLAGGLEGSTADRIVEDFEPEARRLYLDPASARRFPAVRGYLRTRDDAEFAPPVQRRFADELGPAWTEELPTGHLPMLQRPAAVGQGVRRLLASLSAEARPVRRCPPPPGRRRGPPRPVAPRA